jgi:hypothetical protein
MIGFLSSGEVSLAFFIALHPSAHQRDAGKPVMLNGLSGGRLIPTPFNLTSFNKPERGWQRARTSDKSPENLGQLALAAHQRAIAGDVGAMTFIRDTIDGKPARELVGAHGGPISLLGKAQNRDQPVPRNRGQKIRGVESPA